MNGNRCNITRAARSRTGFTLIEIMIVIAILGVVLAIAMPTWVRQREHSQRTSCQENLSKIDGAKEQYAMDNNIPAGTAIALGELYSEDGTGYLLREPVCPSGGNYTPGNVGADPTCDSTNSGHTLEAIHQQF